MIARSPPPGSRSVLVEILEGEQIVRANRKEERRCTIMAREAPSIAHPRQWAQFERTRGGHLAQSGPTRRLQRRDGRRDTDHLACLSILHQMSSAAVVNETRAPSKLILFWAPIQMSSPAHAARARLQSYRVAILQIHICRQRQLLSGATLVSGASPTGRPAALNSRQPADGAGVCSTPNAGILAKSCFRLRRATRPP